MRDGYPNTTPRFADRHEGSIAAGLLVCRLCDAVYRASRGHVCPMTGERAPEPQPRPTAEQIEARALSDASDACDACVRSGRATKEACDHCDWLGIGVIDNGRC